jgi:GxxExxY protein
MTDNELTHAIIGAAMEVHRILGPGLLESTYRNRLLHELQLRGFTVLTERPIPVVYKQTKLECGFRLDLRIEDRTIVELKSIQIIAPVHQATLLTYLRLSGRRLGLLINFNADVLKNGVRRYIMDTPKAFNTERTELSAQRSQRHHA